jgi:tRNA dimethylallyltransferase
MFAAGLVEETRNLIATFGPDCRPFESLGYAQASAVLAGTLIEAEAIAETAQGHRNYAKRQMTWFRREAQLHEVHWLPGPGDSPAILAQAAALVASHLA